MSTQIVCPYNNLPCRTGFCREGVCNVLEIMKHPDGQPQPTTIGTHQINQNPLIIGTVSANASAAPGGEDKQDELWYAVKDIFFNHLEYNNTPEDAVKELKSKYSIKRKP